MSMIALSWTTLSKKVKSCVFVLKIRVGQNSMDALRKVHGKIYRVGPAPELMQSNQVLLCSTFL